MGVLNSEHTFPMALTSAGTTNPMGPSSLTADPKTTKAARVSLGGLLIPFGVITRPPRYPPPDWQTGWRWGPHMRYRCAFPLRVQRLCSTMFPDAGRTTATRLVALSSRVVVACVLKSSPGTENVERALLLYIPSYARAREKVREVDLFSLDPQNTWISG
jgi:hypothetical protein